MLVCVLFCGGCLFTPPVWSPGGNELAYITVSQPQEHWFGTDWPFGPLPGVSQPSAAAAVMAQVRVWNAQTGTDILIDQTPGLLSNVAWAPAGDALCYLRFEPADSQKWRDLQSRSLQLEIANPDDLWEAMESEERIAGTLALLVRRRSGQTDILHETKADFLAAHILLLPWSSPSWSGDGLLLAVGWCSPWETLVLNVETGKIQHRFPGVVMPSWSPTSEQLAMYRVDGQRGFVVTNKSFWPEPRMVQPMEFASEPVVWDPKGGGNFWTVYQHDLNVPRGNLTAPGDGKQLSVVRGSADDASRAEIRAFGLGKNTTSAASLCFDHRTNDLLLSAYAEGFAPAFHLLHAETGAQTRIWHPLGEEDSDAPILIGGQRISATTGLAAFRYGVPDWSAPLALYDLKSREVQFIVPTEESAAPGLWSLAEATGRLVRKLPPQAKSPFGVGKFLSPSQRMRNVDPIEWPLDLFNRPQTQPEEDPAQQRIHNLAGYGLAILKQLPSVKSDRLREAEIFFRYSRQEYAAAFDGIQALLRQSNLAPARKQVLSAVACQCAVATGNRDWARDVLTELIHERTALLRRTMDFDAHRELQLLGVNDNSTPPSPATGTDLDDPLLDRLRSLWDHLQAQETKAKQ